MTRRFEFFEGQGSLWGTWICFDMKHGQLTHRWGMDRWVFPCREVSSRKPEDIRVGYIERDGICDYDPVFPGSVRPYSPVRRKDIPKDVLARLEFPKES